MSAINERLNEQLAAFRDACPAKHLQINGSEWHYLTAGGGDDCLLMLPGAFGVAEMGFQLIDALKHSLRVVAPSYGPARNVADVLSSLEAIVDAEGLERVNVLGGSFGGALAQCWAREHEDRTNKLVLSHTIAPDRRYARRMSVASRVTRLLPMPLNRALMRRRVETLLPEDFEARDFWRTFLLGIVAKQRKESLASVMTCMHDFIANYGFRSDDLEGWADRILIIESDNDPSVGEDERSALRALYPQARVHTFHGTGHASAILAVDAYVELVKDFLLEDPVPRPPLPRP